MATGGSIKSRGKVQQNCDSCKQDGKQRNAEYHCGKCSEYLCNDCKEAHRRVSITRGHKLTKVPLLSGTTSVMDSSDEVHDCDPCKTVVKNIETVVKNIEAIYYCGICKEYMCGGCGYGHRKFKFSKNHKLTNLHGSRHNNDVILNLTPQSIIKVNVKIVNDKEVPRITGCTVLSTGELLLCDHKNFNIKLLNKSLKISDSVTLGCSRPWDIAVVNDKTAIVTLPNDKQLQYIDLVPKLSLGSRMPTKQNCWGIVVVNDLIYITCHGYLDSPGGDIRVLDLRGNELKIIGVNRDGSQLLQEPFYIASNREGSKLYVTSYNTNEICCISSSGDVIYKLKDADKWAPNGVYVDSQDNLLVCSRSTDTIQVITASGTKHKTLLTSYDGVKKPVGIAFCPTSSTLIVSLSKRDEILVVKLA